MALALTVFLIISVAGIASGQSGNPDTVDPRTLYQRGRAEQARSNLLVAVELYRAALNENPAYLEPLIGLAESFFALEEYEESLEYLKQAQRYDRGNLDLVVLEGRIAIAMSHPARARELFETVLAEEPNNLEARFGLAELDIAQGRTRNASRIYIETLKIRPDSQKALLSLVLLSEAQGEIAAAQAYLELALKYHNYDPRVHYVAGRFSMEEGDLDRAEAYLLTATALDGQYAEAQRLLAHVYLLKGNPQRAVDILRRIIENNRDLPLVWYSLGHAYVRSGDPRQGIRSLAQVLRLTPDDEIARIALEQIALTELPLDDPIRGRYAEYHLKRGELFREKNLLDKAMLEYRRALRLQPEAEEPRLQYAELHRLMGYPEKYMKELEVLRDLGYTETVISDDIEIISAERYDSVSARWGVDQYDLDRRRFSAVLFHLVPATREVHPFAGQEVAAYLHDLLLRYPTIELLQPAKDVDNFESAFREARRTDCDYFLLMHVEESERSFLTVVDQYLTATGKKLRTYQVFRTGNDRIQENCKILAARLFDALPIRGGLLARQFDRGVVDLGKVDGLEQGQELAIVRKGGVRLRNDVIGVIADYEDILGEFTVEQVDEVVSEGIVVKRSFFDLINAGDEIVVLNGAQEDEQPQEEMEPGLLRRVLNLIGR